LIKLLPADVDRDGDQDIITFYKSSMAGWLENKTKARKKK